MKYSIAARILPIVSILPLLGSCRNSDPTSIKEYGRGIDATFENGFPTSVAPGETVILHVACHINSLPAGPFHAYLDVYADRNLSLQSVRATSSLQGLMPINGTLYPAFDSNGIGFYFGPLHTGDVPFVDLVYRVKTNPEHFAEPSGFFGVHIGTAILQDLNLEEGYSHGVTIDTYVPIVQPQ